MTHRSSAGNCPWESGASRQFDRKKRRHARAGHRAKIVGVISSHATTHAEPIAAGRVVAAPMTAVLANGRTCRVADTSALPALMAHLDHVVKVNDEAVVQAMRHLFEDTHNVAEGAGAASFATAWQERESLKDLAVGTTLCGGNMDSAVIARVLSRV